MSRRNGYLRKFRALLRKYGRVCVVWTMPPKSAAPSIRVSVDMRFVGKFKGRYYADVFKTVYSVCPPTSVVVSLAKRKTKNGNSARPVVSIVW